MTNLSEKIETYMRKCPQAFCMQNGTVDELAESMATRIESDYTLTPKTDQPDVYDPNEHCDKWTVHVATDSGKSQVIIPAIEVPGDPGYSRVMAKAWTAIAEHLESQATAEARLQERREDLAQQYGFDQIYSDLSTMERDLINRLLHSEDRISELEAS